MAITINLGTPTVDLTTSIGTITDGSTYTSPSRATCGVYVKVYKTDYSGTRSYETTTSNNSDPNTDSIWTFAYASDGWHQVAYVAAPDYSAGVSYAKYDAVFDPTNKLVYRSKTNANLGNSLLNSTYWENISDPASLAFNIGLSSESLNLTALTSAAVLNILLDPFIRQAFGTQAGNSFLEATSDYKRSEDVRLYELLGLAAYSIEIANNRQEYSAGENFARRAYYLIENAQ